MLILNLEVHVVFSYISLIPIIITGAHSVLNALQYEVDNMCSSCQYVDQGLKQIYDINYFANRSVKLLNASVTTDKDFRQRFGLESKSFFIIRGCCH